VRRYFADEPQAGFGLERFADYQVFPMPFPKGDPDWPQLLASIAQELGPFLLT